MTLRWYGAELYARAHVGAMRGVTVGIGIVEDHWVGLLTNGNPSGRTYRRRGIVHQASAPGQPPASDTGTLVNSRVITIIPERTAARMTITAAHAPHLEHGTKKMEPRPSAQRALLEKQEEVRQAIIAEVVASLR